MMKRKATEWRKGGLVGPAAELSAAADEIAHLRARVSNLRDALLNGVVVVGVLYELLKPVEPSPQVVEWLSDAKYLILEGEE